MAKAIHTMVRVLDEARSLAFYKKAFGLDIADRLDFPDFTLVYLSNSQTPYEVELTINKDRTEPYNLGDGYGHVAFVVEDLDAEHRRLRPRASSRARSWSSTKMGRRSPVSSSSKIPTATRSRCCRGSVASGSRPRLNLS